MTQLAGNVHLSIPSLARWRYQRTPGLATLASTTFPEYDLHDTCLPVRLESSSCHYRPAHRMDMRETAQETSESPYFLDFRSICAVKSPQRSRRGSRGLTGRYQACPFNYGQAIQQFEV